MCRCLCFTLLGLFGALAGILLGFFFVNPFLPKTIPTSWDAKGCVGSVVNPHCFDLGSWTPSLNFKVPEIILTKKDKEYLLNAMKDKQ